jgi:hypothetical protein
MTDHALRVVPDVPRASAIIHAPPKGKLALSGEGPDRLVCGSCSEPLVVGASQEQLFGAYIQCPECGSVNAVSE